MLTDEQLKTAFQNAVKSNDTVYLLYHFIEISGCFRQGIAKDDRTECYLRGKGDFGLYLRNLFLEFAPETYAELIKNNGKD